MLSRSSARVHARAEADQPIDLSHADRSRLRHRVISLSISQYDGPLLIRSFLSPL